MQLCVFITANAGSAPPPAPRKLEQEATGIAGMRRLIVHRPVAGRLDPRVGEAADAPAWALQAYFDELEPLERAAADDGPLHRALLASLGPGHRSDQCSYQVMAVRVLAAPAGTPPHAGTTRCSYLVAYEGPAQDLHAWLSHYLAHHPPLMRQLPGLRELEVYTRVDSSAALPYARSTAMQRNKVVFDDPRALAQALASPIRDAMRRDYHALPAFTGGTPHCAMLSAYYNLE